MRYRLQGLGLADNQQDNKNGTVVATIPHQ